ncbi:MAG: amidohydrolase family protein [Candidatus Euphemobacter frigidus]|nr:amidohydrolase family protein [Candidatus Euphemobacter frigidus]MDP8276125.1 amidohydrolase family protein [Candidatus Euphemobacter frigidus]
MNRKYKLIRSRLLLPLSEELGLSTRIEDGYVLIDGEKIKEVGEYTPEVGERIVREGGNDLQVIGSEKEGDLREEDVPCLNGVVLPGFVKAHGHDHESPLIGIAKDEPLTDWLDHAVNVFTGFLNENAEELTERFGDSANLITYTKARLDDIYYGITSALTHHCNFNKYHVAELVEANVRAGTKIIIAVGSQDRNYDPRILDTPEEAVKRMDKYTAEFGDRERTWIIPGPDQVFSNSAEMIKALKKWARAHGTLFHMHSSEEPNTTAWFYQQYLYSPVGYLQQAGVLDDMTILAHQVNNTPVDLDILKETGTNIVHNPLANTILGSGMPPVIEMLEMGIPVAISTDGSGSSDSQNMLSAARLASQYQKAFHKNARLLPAQQVLEMVTVVPAKMLRLNTGMLSAGRDADLVLIDLRRPNLTPTRIDNVVENLIWAADGSEVRWVIANGKLLKDDYRFLTLDEEKIKDNIRQLSELLIEYKKSHQEIKATGARQKEG